MVRVLRQTDILQEVIAEYIPELVENFIWFQVVRISKVEQIEFFFSLMEAMTSEERAALFDADLVIPSTSYILDHLWLTESEKPKAEQGWQPILNLYDKAALLHE